MVTLEIDCKLCKNEYRCDWRCQTEAMRHRDCMEYDPKIVRDIKAGNMITIENFTDAVRIMRTKQNLYFRIKSPAALEDAKQAESTVDRMLRQYDADQQQLSLFH